MTTDQSIVLEIDELMSTINTTVDKEFVDLLEFSSPYSRPELYKAIADEIRKDNIEQVNRISEQVKPKSSIYSKYIKRLLDIIISLIALIITFPINFIIFIITIFDVGFPIFFKQKRIGRNGKPFKLVKFRNMRNDCDENGNLLPASKRVTKFGRFIRRTSLDELLNFWSIFKGDMSLIGPRPLEMVYSQRYSKRHEQRTAVRPGLECPIIKTLDHNLTWCDQFENDIYYVENVSFGLDVKMIFLLVKMVFNSKSNSMRGASARGGFLGYNPDGTSINAKNVPAKYVERALEKLSQKKAG